MRSSPTYYICLLVAVVALSLVAGPHIATAQDAAVRLEDLGLNPTSTAAKRGLDAAESLDLDAAQERGEAEAKKLEHFSETIRLRGDEVRRQALEIAQGAQANTKAYWSAQRSADPDAFDAMIAEAQAAREEASAEKDRPLLLSFISLSMPPEAIRALVRDTTKAGGHVVLRGFINNNARKTVAAMQEVFDDPNEAAGIGVDPRLFRAYEITAAPSIVITTADVDLCDGFDCVSSVPAHHKIAGNVTLGYALSQIAREGDAAGQAATAYYKRLESEQ